jgi:hypothetical protein
VSVGQKATFAVQATGTKPLSYQWKKNGTNIAGVTKRFYTTPPTTQEDNGAVFMVPVSDRAGSVTSNNATLTVTRAAKRTGGLSHHRRKCPLMSAVFIKKVALLLLVIGLRQALPPNIVVILADDLGYGDIGFNGCPDIPTPNIDSLATNGVLCSSGYVTHPFSSPSQAGLLTGRYQQRFGHENNPQSDQG